MEAVTERPSLHDQQIARESLTLVGEALNRKRSEEVSIQLQPGMAAQGFASVVIPTKALHLLAVILSSMAQGKAVSLIPSDSEISTQQAADLLGVSRPHLVKLLEKGTIPFKKVGSHRRVLLEDLLIYKERQEQVRHEQLQFLAEQAQDLNLGYE